MLPGNNLQDNSFMDHSRHLRATCTQEVRHTPVEGSSYTFDDGREGIVTLVKVEIYKGVEIDTGAIKLSGGGFRSVYNIKKLN